MNENRMELVLKGLCCSNCAMKIEKKVGDLKTVKSANLNFATKILYIEPEDAIANENIIKDVVKIVKSIEPGVMVKEKKNRQNKANIQSEKVQDYKVQGKEHSHGHKINGQGQVHSHIDCQEDEILEHHMHGKAQCSLNEGEAGCDCCVGELPEEDRFLRNKLLSFGTAAVLYVIALVFDLPDRLEFVLFLICYLIAGGKVLLQAGRNIAKGEIFDENFLMAIATIGAFAIGQFPEGVAVMLFYQIGEMFQGIAVNRSRKSIADLMDIRPDYANLKTGDKIKTVSPQEVRIGDILIVKPGEKIPLDGKVTEGSSVLDTSALTGESMPREVKTGDLVLSGFINKNGLLTMEVTRAFDESTVSKILDLVQNASSRKAPTENFITKFARKYTPAVTIAALLLAIVPPLVIPGASVSDWIYRALVFLVISCPCALVISIPLGFFGGIGGASRHGVLVKGSNYLEALNNVDTVVFDKTGTLTKGVFQVTGLETGTGFTKEELLMYAAFAESYSNHPIALSILKAYGRETDKDQITDYNELSGLGIQIRLKGKTVLAGNAKLMERFHIPYKTPANPGTVVYVAVDQRYAGSLVISDEIKEDSADAIKALKKLGVQRVVMLTGDSRDTGNKIGALLGMDEVHTELLPDEKVHNLEMLDQQKTTKGKLVFLGDGINDAPVLARADIGVAMGGLGSDAAIEAADVVLMTDEPSKLVTAMKIAKKTHSIVWQNIVFALSVKLIVLVLGAFGVATMWEAVFADVGVALIAVLNAMRAMNMKA